jgi:hypothetical protein
LRIGDISSVKRISGTPAGQNVVQKLKLKKKDGSDVVSLEGGNFAQICGD